MSDEPFGGDIMKFREWHDLMRDHLLGANQGYGRIPYELEKEQGHLRALVDTMGRLVEEMELEDGFQTITKYTSQCEDSLKTGEDPPKTVEDRLKTVEDPLKTPTFKKCGLRGRRPTISTP